ncbi:MAG: ABC transporter substrate-binding protein [Bacillota bacterium]|nr:ABC transporter substrate-binding protein [Bacillota bacterium]
MKKLRTLALAITIVSVMILTTGCTTYQHFKTAFMNDSTGENVTITIGVCEPITGGESDAAISEIRGIQLANEVYPNIKGKIVKLVYSNNYSDVSAAKTAIENLFSYSPNVILGSYGSAYSLAISKKIQDAKIPAIAVSNTNPLVTKNNPYYYRVCYADSNQGDLLGTYVLKATKSKTAGILLPENSDIALARASAFSERMEVQTGDSDAIKVYKTYKSGTKNFTKQLEAVRDSGVKYVLLPGEMVDVAEILKEAKAMNLDVTFLGGNEWASEEFDETVGKYANSNNVAFITYVDPAIENDEQKAGRETEKFMNAFRDKYGNDAVPDENMMLGYDAYLVAINAAAQAGDNMDGESIKKALDGDITFEGATGNIRFNDVGDPVKTVYVSTVSKDGHVLKYTINPAN